MDAVYQRNKTIIITAFVTMLATSLIWLGIGSVGYWFISDHTPDFDLNIDHPETVEVGEVFKVKVSVRNAGYRELNLENIDLYDGLIDGFEIVSLKPKPRLTEKIIGYDSLVFSEKLDTGETFELEIEMRAKETGSWAGDVDACDTLQKFVTHYTEIEVIDKGTEAPE